VRANLAMPATIGLREPADGVIALPGALPLLLVLQLIDEVRQQSDVAILPKQRAIGRESVTTCASGFLIKLLDRFWHRQVNDRAH
jgi:hypothetical protein